MFFLPPASCPGAVTPGRGYAVLPNARAGARLSADTHRWYLWHLRMFRDLRHLRHLRMPRICAICGYPYLRHLWIKEGAANERKHFRAEENGLCALETA
jgi:hypothetical protein